MLLSIIIPVYNVEDYLCECLDSIFNQDLTECEVIAVNDGSTDDSGSILEKYQKTYPQLIVIHQENKGLSGARNTGMEYAKGDYLYFLDSDDFLLSNVLKTILLKIKETKSEIIGFNAKVNNISQYVAFKSLFDECKTGIDFFVDFYKSNGFYPYINVPLYVYNKKFINKSKIRFLEGYYHEDIHFSMKLFYLTKSIIIFNFPIFSYRQQREGSICTNVQLKNLTDVSLINRELNTFYNSNNFCNIFFQNKLFHSYISILCQGVELGYYPQRKQYFSKEVKKIMKKGITNEYEYKLWLLTCMNIKLLNFYLKGKLPATLRRLINIIGTAVTLCKSKQYLRIIYNN